MSWCVLTEDKVCDHCGACQRCDLNPEKICDNCMACIKGDADYRAIRIDAVILSDDSKSAEQGSI